MESTDADGGGQEEPDLETDGGVACPVCGDEFESQKGMEAHVSGSNGEHEGMVGTDVRDDLKGAIEFPENPETNAGDDLDDALDELDEIETEPESESDGSDEMEIEDRSGSDGPLKAVIGWMALVAIVGVVWTGGLGFDDGSDEPEVMLL